MKKMATKSQFTGAGRSSVLSRPATRRVSATCGAPVKFLRRRSRPFRVIANVYIDGTWDRVEHYHADCYEQSGCPYGSAA